MNDDELAKRLDRIEAAIRRLTFYAARNRHDVADIETALTGTDATQPDWRDGQYHGGH